MSIPRRGDQVAVLPMQSSPPERVIGLAIVAYVGPALIELDNGHMYFIKDGQCMTDGSCIVPATEEHRAAIGGLQDA